MDSSKIPKSRHIIPKAKERTETDQKSAFLGGFFVLFRGVSRTWCTVHGAVVGAV